MYRTVCPKALVILLVLPQVSSLSNAQADDSQLAVIAAGYRESLSRLTSIHATFEKRVEFTEQAGSLRERVSLPTDLHVLEWATDGRRHLFHLEPAAAGEQTLRDYRSSDGRHFWNVEWSDEDRPLQIFQREQSQVSSDWFRESRGPGQFLGWMLDVGHDVRMSSLESLLGDSTATLIGQTTLDDHLCWNVEFGPFPGEKGDHDLWIAAWFDPEVGFLPRLITFWSAESGGNEALPKTENSNRVTEFRRVENISGWFPETMVMESWLARETFELRELSVGQRLPMDLFQPDYPGVPVVNLSDPNSKEVHDKELIAAAEVEREAAALPVAERPFVDATPPAPGSTTRWWLLVAGGLFMILTVSVWFLGRR